MSIRVAYDISLLGNHVGRADPKCGISRVYEELLFELSKRDDIDLTAVALCDSGDGNLLHDSIKSHLYFKMHEERIHGRFAHSFKSRLGLTRFYRDAFSAYFAEELNGVKTYTLNSILKRGARGILYRLHHTYGIDRLYSAFDSERYDVFHSPHLRLPPESLTKSVPRVLTVYDLIPILAPEFVTPQQTLYLQQLLDSINVERDWVTCISQHTKNEFCEYTRMSPERVFVTPLAASSLFHPVGDALQVAAVRQRYGLPEGAYFLSLAAPQPRKNLSHLIRCFFRLLDEQPALDASLVLAGSKEQGWLYDEIFAASESSSKHRARVIFTDYVADEDLAALYSGALAFVFPSLYEGFGLPPLEAMACGTPVITSNTTALPEVVGEAGLTVGPRDEEALCEAMLSVAEDDALRAELGRSVLRRASEFSWRRCAEQTAAVYHAAAAERTAHGV